MCASILNGWDDMRVAIVQELFAILRRSGYAGYEVQGVNAPDKVLFGSKRFL